MAQQQVDPREEFARPKRLRMVQLESAYLRAKEYVKSDQFALDQIATLERIKSAMSPTPKDQGQAFFTIGRIEQLLIDAYRFQDVITEYESAKKSLDEMFKD